MKPNVLLLDTTRSAYKLLHKCLETLGCRVYRTTFQKDEVEAALEKDYDLIILNPYFQDNVGLSIIRDIRAHKNHKACPILSLSYNKSERDILEAYWAGTTDYIVLPINLEILYAKLKAQVCHLNTQKDTKIRFQTKIIQFEQDVSRAAKSLATLGKLPEVPGINISIFEQPIHRIGGDFVDVVKREDGTWLIAVGDIMGHGIQAAVFQPLIRRTLRLHMQKLESVENTLIALNEAVLTNMMANHFVALCLIEWKPDTRDLTIYRHGFPYPMYYQLGQLPVAIKPGGSILGISPSDKLKKTIKSWTTKLGPEDSLVLFSDGVSEAKNIDGEDVQKSSSFTHILKPSEDFADQAVTIYNRLKHRQYTINDDVLVVVLSSKK